MGRPKLYKTPEERVLAARAYRAKYYASHKNQINQNVHKKRISRRGLITSQIMFQYLVNQKHQRYCLGRKPRQKSNAQPEMDHAAKTTGTPPTHPTIPTSDLTTGNTVSKVELALQNLTGGSLRLWVESLCTDYVKSNDYSNINNSHNAIGTLEAELQAIRRTTKRDHNGAHIAERLRLVSRILEDLLLHAMEGNDIVDLRGRGVLLYQSVGVVI
ncbi:hypothetical protein L210DRAFT_3657622 [Boletus edulis BED1]|uniref:Uncharacterized protein n=1 Tax=Boletus edulis BED1 TaxID=1328754 RepID=A0AAD4BA43_BOLED|nr:hypothetical protein L210DRAFT_3657622 [Boletus edulis BED1]